jgi:hypothetical protein
VKPITAWGVIDAYGPIEVTHHIVGYERAWVKAVCPSRASARRILRAADDDGLTDVRIVRVVIRDVPRKKAKR